MISQLSQKTLTFIKKLTIRKEGVQKNILFFNSTNPKRMNTFRGILKEVSNNLRFYSIEDSITESNYKRFAELAIMFGYAKKYAEKLCPEEEFIIRTFLIQQMKLVSSDRIFKNYYTSYHLILPYISIRDFQKIRYLENCLEIIVNNKMLSSEIPPHRQMEWGHMMQKIGIVNEIEIPENSILNKTIHLQYLSRELTYSITHALFYITDFGNKKSIAAIKNPKKMEFILGTLIAKTALKDDIDLLLELTINYLSLHHLTEIDFDILYLVHNSLCKTNFVEFNLNEEKTIKKYHTLFVLNILCVQLFKISESDKLLTKHQEGIINSILNNENSTFYDEDKNHKFQDSWEIINSFKGKNFNFEGIEQYYKKWGYCHHLSSEVVRYICHLEERAKRDIIWERESNKLKLKPIQQQRLNEQLLDLLSKERRNLKANKLEIKKYS